MQKMKYSGVEWIGEIPEDWGIVKVKQAFIRKNEKAQQENPVVLSLARSGVRVRDVSTNEGQVAESYYNYNPVSIGDLLLNPMDLYSGANCSISEVEGVISPAYVNLRNRNGYYSKFYDYYFKVQYWMMVLFAHGKGVSFDNRWTLNNETLMNFPVVSPDYDTQRRIADFLDDKCGKIDRYIEKQQQIIDKLKEYKQAVITEAVTKGLNPEVPMKDSGIEWIGMIPKHWDVHKFCWDYNSSLGKMLDTKRVKGTFLFKYIKNTNVHWGSIDLNDLDEMDFDFSELDRYSLQPGDLMICEGGEIGKCAIIPNDFPKNIFYQKALHRVRPVSDDSNNEFLFYVMFCMAKNNYFFSSSEKATIAHLPGDTLNSLRIPFPPKKEQEFLVQHLNDESSKIDCAIAKQTSIIEKLTEYKKSLIYEAVTGKLEV